MYTIIIAYFIGALPFSFIVPRLVKGIDIRTVGSGNVGATNVLRACGFFWALLAFLGDFSKGFVAFYLANHFAGYEIGLIAAFCALFGHCYTCFLKFDGGKGVATFTGILLALAPDVCLIYVAIILTIIFATKIVSIASITGIATAPIIALALHKNDPLILYLLIAGIFIIFQHRSNIARILKGEEKRVNFKKKK